MQTARPRRWRAATAAAAAVAFALGCGVAWATRDRPLLPVELGIEMKASARDQYDYAVGQGTPSAWRSVADYFPNDVEFAPRAQRQLAQWYFDQRDYELAYAEFALLANWERAAPRMQAEGLLGQVRVREAQNRYSEMEAKLAELRPMRRELGPTDQEALRKLVARHRDKLNEQTLEEWQPWLDRPPAGPLGRRSGRLWRG
jgi:hypothetical protein